MIMGFWD